MTHLAPDGLQLGFVAEQLVDKAAGEAHTEYQLWNSFKMVPKISSVR